MRASDCFGEVAAMLEGSRGLLEGRNIKHSYGGREVLALDEISLERGSITALVGPNGSGKSTLLRVLGFLEKPKGGSLFLNGTPIVNGRDRLNARRAITLVEQQPLLFKGSVQSNMEYGLTARRTDSIEARQRVAEALGFLDIVHLASRDGGSLSDGEKQQVAVARALSIKPRVLLLDEPTSAADRTKSNRIYEAIKDARSRGLAICVASHRLEEAYRWSDLVLSLALGRATPVTPENVFRVSIPTGESPKAVRISNLTVFVVTDTTGPATIAMPPDELIVSSDRFISSARNQFSGRVTRIAELGRGQVALTVDVGVELTAHITPESLSSLALTVGANAVLSIKAMAVRVF